VIRPTDPAFEHPGGDLSVKIAQLQWGEARCK
jgi:hypothetical protein